MTEELQPGLGSGALREALEQRIKECRETAERWKTESRNVRIDRAIHKDYSIALDALANLLEAALSLSSPIEPDRDLLLAEIARKWAQSTVEGLVRRNIIGRYLADEADARDGIADSIKGAIHEALSVGGAQASSEIREAGEELAQAFALFDGTLGKNWMNTARAQALVALDRWRAPRSSKKS